MKNTNTSSSGDQAMVSQYERPSTGPSCQMATKLWPIAARMATSTAKGARNDTTMGIIRTGRRIHTAPARITP